MLHASAGSLTSSSSSTRRSRLDEITEDEEEAGPGDMVTDTDKTVPGTDEATSHGKSQLNQHALKTVVAESQLLQKPGLSPPLSLPRHSIPESSPATSPPVIITLDKSLPVTPEAAPSEKEIGKESSVLNKSSFEEIPRASQATDRSSIDQRPSIPELEPHSGFTYKKRRSWDHDPM